METTETQVQVDAAKQKLVDSLVVYNKFWCKVNHFSFRRDFSVENVRTIDDDGDDSSLSGSFFRVPYIGEAGLAIQKEPMQPLVSSDGKSVQPRAFSDIESVQPPIFYRRKGVERLWSQIDELPAGKMLFVRGQPGIGKSTGIWKKLLMMASKDDGLSALWVSLDLYGHTYTAVYFQGRNFYKFRFRIGEMEAFLGANKRSLLPLNLVVVDGLNQASSLDLIEKVTAWVLKDPTRRVIFSSSYKVRELRPHQNNTTYYLTIQSWTLEEFESACIENKNEESVPSPFWHQVSHAFQDFTTGDDSVSAEAEVASEDETEDVVPPAVQNSAAVVFDVDTISAAIQSKYRWSGGCALWMFNFSIAQIEALLRKYCEEPVNRKAILDGAIGPTSSASTNYFFGSSLTNDNKTEYFLVSQQAVAIFVQHSTNQASLESSQVFVNWLESKNGRG